MEKQFVTYEIAKKLKELGFDEKCFAYYTYNDIDKDRFHLQYPLVTNAQLFDPLSKAKYQDVSAPLWQQVISWFMEKKGIHFIFTQEEVMNVKSKKSAFMKNSIDADFLLGDTWHVDAENCSLLTESKKLFTISQVGYDKAMESAILKALELIK
jgi:hypothetical protein